MYIYIYLEWSNKNKLKKTQILGFKVKKQINLNHKVKDIRKIIQLKFQTILTVIQMKEELKVKGSL
jgi:hypothetical protein